MMAGPQIVLMHNSWPNDPSIQHIMVAMSGGVDSSYTAWLVQQSGLPCAGMFMKNWEEDDAGNCPAEQDAADARQVADHLGLKFYARNFSAEYWDDVFEDFLNEYRIGRTPNPDILCNREIKFKVFLEHARDLGASHIATGHYARKRITDDGHQLCKAADQNKDQTYFLYAISQQQLQQALFPLADIDKTNLRQKARETGIPVHAKKDSTGICFIGEKRLQDFLVKWLPRKRGDIKTEDGQTIGQHNGAQFYTLGQRQGLGIGGVRGAAEAPWYVIGKNMDNNVLFVSQEHQHDALMSRQLSASHWNWINSAPADTSQLTAKIRYRQMDQNCMIDTSSGNMQIGFVEAQWAVTPGQSVVLYDGEVCLGGGIIETSDAPVVS